MDAATKRVLDSGWYLLGREPERFEADFAAYCGVNHCIGCADGLDVLKLMIKAYGFGPGDGIIILGKCHEEVFIVLRLMRLNGRKGALHGRLKNTVEMHLP